MNSYWVKYPRDFANEFTVGISTAAHSVANYKEGHFEKITRRHALRKLSRKPEGGDELHRSVTIDDFPIRENAGEIVRMLRGLEPFKVHAY
jgi:hypothetical protein